jgi:ABC-type nitrate/sulfonate/bicarbonate transport system permease component
MARPNPWAVTGRTIAGFYPLAIVALLWEGAARMGAVPPIFLPSLSESCRQLWTLATSGDLIEPLGVSLYRAAVGLLIAAAVGVTFGIAMARVRAVRWLLRPLVALGFPAPKVAFLPIFILWFGIDHVSKIALVAITSVFPFVVAAQAGASSVPQVQIWAAEAMATSRIGTFWRVVLPASLPSLMSGMRVAIPYALVSAFTAEMIAGGGGLGGDLVYAQRNFDTPTVYAILLVMLALGYVIDVAVLAVRARVLRWATPTGE